MYSNSLNDYPPLPLLFPHLGRLKFCLRGRFNMGELPPEIVFKDILPIFASAWHILCKRMKRALNTLLGIPTHQKKKKRLLQYQEKLQCNLTVVVREGYLSPITNLLWTDEPKYDLPLKCPNNFIYNQHTTN